MRVRGLCLLAAASILRAQTDVPPAPDALTFNGSPLVVPFTCDDADLEWAGLACADEPCPIYLELLHAAGNGNTVFVTGDFHAPNVTLRSLLLRTEDGGRTWREPLARIRGAELDQAQMYSAQVGWVSGQSMQPLALDPFLLLTADGGKSWRRVPFFEDEGTPGAVLQFRFDTRDHGIAWIDHGAGPKRFEEYETQSGGDTWTLHGQFDRRPTLAEPQENGWRIVPEPKLFRLQKEEDGGWHPFTSFSVDAAHCGAKPTQSNGKQ